MENLSDIQSHNSDFLEKASLRLDTMNKQADSAQERTDALILQANEIIKKLSTGALGNAFIEEIVIFADIKKITCLIHTEKAEHRRIIPLTVEA